MKNKSNKFNPKDSLKKNEEINSNILTDWIIDYIISQKSALDSINPGDIVNLINIFSKAAKEGRHIFVFGNGGSASNSSHFITDLGKGASDVMENRFRCLSLNDNISWITALGNDKSYEQVYSEQLRNFGKPGDIAMALSVSGSSPNVVRAIDLARDLKMQTIALVGGKQGELYEIAETVIVVDSEHYGRVEDIQMTICHMICYAFMENAV